VYNVVYSVVCSVVYNITCVVLQLTVAKTMADMDSLAKSEEALKELQVKLKREELEKRQHIQHKEKLEEQVNICRYQMINEM